MNDIEKLIEEARKWGPESMSSRLIRRLADALEDAEKRAETELAPTDDEREALSAEAEKVQSAAWAEIHGQDPQRTYSVAEVKRIVYSFDNVLSSALRCSEVPESSIEDGTPREFQAYELTVDMLEDLLVTASVRPGAHDIAIRKTAGALVHKIGARFTPKAQGEPSDAQVLAALNAYGPESATDDLSDYHEVNRDAMRNALRAAGGLR